MTNISTQDLTDIRDALSYFCSGLEHQVEIAREDKSDFLSSYLNSSLIYLNRSISYIDEVRLHLLLPPASTAS